MTQAITDDIHIDELRPLLSPAILMEELPLGEASAQTIKDARGDIKQILRGDDDRLIVIAGPCSIHDPNAAIEYAQRLRVVMKQFKSELFVIMRVYFEKPRTTVGWKGLINDPHLDDSFDINSGLRIARKLLLDISDLGIPTGCEFLDTISPQFYADLVSWGAIGARTTESQVHRELASGLSMPIGFKNGTDGNIQIAVDAIRAAAHQHHFLSVTKQGISAIVQTKGNHHCHVILRGSSTGPNYDKNSISETIERLKSYGLHQRVMVDCSHGNSNKDFRQQSSVVENISQQIMDGSTSIAGVMLESNLVEGNQKSPDIYGKSITDGCISWEDTVEILHTLASSVKHRRLKYY